MCGHQHSLAGHRVQDPYFPVARCKDFFMSYSWASGIPTVGGQPYMNGRNQESTSEACSLSLPPPPADTHQESTSEACSC